MKLRQLTFCLWAIAAGASLADYQELCPSMHETKHEIQPGQWVLVKCGWVGSHDGRKSRVGDIRTPAACVQLCSDDPACTHSSWGLGEKCLLSGSKFTEREVKNSVLLIMTTPDDLQDECPEDNPYCDDDEEEEEEEEICEEQLEESETQLENCEEEKSIYQEQLAECLIEQETLAQQVFELQSAELSPKVDVPECDMSHGTIFTARNNKRFRIDCRKGGNFKPFQDYNSETFARCIDECADNHHCKAAEFVKSGQCKLYHLGKRDSGRWISKENRSLALLIAE